MRSAPSLRYDVEVSDPERDYFECLVDPSVRFEYRGVSEALKRLAHVERHAQKVVKAEWWLLLGLEQYRAPTVTIVDQIDGDEGQLAAFGA